MSALTVIWISSAFGFYVINFMVRHFPGSFTTNLSVMYSADIIVSLCTGLLVTYSKPKNVLFAFSLIMVLSGLSILIVCDFEDKK
mgnify:CR=1 FL=1